MGAISVPPAPGHHPPSGHLFFQSFGRWVAIRERAFGSLTFKKNRQTAKCKSTVCDHDCDVGIMSVSPQKVEAKCDIFSWRKAMYNVKTHFIQSLFDPAKPAYPRDEKSSDHPANTVFGSNDAAIARKGAWNDKTETAGTASAAVATTEGEFSLGMRSLRVCLPRQRGFMFLGSSGGFVWSTGQYDVPIG